MNRTTGDGDEARRTLLFADIGILVYFDVFAACVFEAVTGGTMFYAVVFGGAAFSVGLGLLFCVGLRRDTVKGIREEAAAK